MPSTMEKPIVVLDANAFISAQSLLELGASHRLITTPDVLDELRDSKTREMLEKFPFKIEELQCDTKSLNVVKEFAKKTGDMASLSDVDMELLALNYMLHVQYGKGEQLRKQPLEIKETVKEESEEEGEEESEGSQEEPTQQPQGDSGPAPHQEGATVHHQETQGAEEDESHHQETQGAEEDEGWIVVPEKKARRAEQSEDDLDDNEGWVTPKNYEQKMAENMATFSQSEEPSEELGSSIWLMTADYAMQNVAIQMGMLLKSLDGRRITQVRRFILECYLCWKTSKIDSNKVKLCKECGYNSLSKIAYSMTGDGRMILHRKKGWEPNKKVLEWKERKYEEQQRKKKHQHAKRKKQASIFD